MRIPVPDNYPNRWTRWFAWHPVFVDGSWIWLERVERRCTFSSMDVWWEYRRRMMK